jgi:hypothetical protein
VSGETAGICRTVHFPTCLVVVEGTILILAKVAAIVRVLHVSKNRELVVRCAYGLVTEAQRLGNGVFPAA